MNIRVDLNTSIKDGIEVVFRSPVDCSQITGLIVYYRGADGNTTSQEFMLADAHGNNVGDIDHLFAEDVVVKVILDVTTGMAFVQNADTNAYLESRFDGIIDKLCPSFTESGSAVQCEPLEGTPLEVISEIPYISEKLDSITLTRLGANLITQPYARGTHTPGTAKFTVNDDYSITVDNEVGTTAVSFLLLGTGTGVNAKLLSDLGIFSGDTITLSVGADLPNHISLQAYFYTEDGKTVTNKVVNNNNPVITYTIGVTVARIYLFVRVSTSTATSGLTVYPMLQHGSVATEYEPYRCEEFTAEVNQTVETVTKVFYSVPEDGCYYEGENWVSGFDMIEYEQVETESEVSAYIDFSYLGNVDTSVEPVIMNDDDGAWRAEFDGDAVRISCDKDYLYEVGAEFPSFQIQAFVNPNPHFTYNWTTGVLIDTNGNETQLTAQPIIALNGVNTIFADIGEVIVTGKKDPVKVVERLEATVNALLGG